MCLRFFFVGGRLRSADVLLSTAALSTSWDNPEAPAGQMGYSVPPVCFGSSPGSPPSWTSSGWCPGGQPHQTGRTTSAGSAHRHIGPELFPHIPPPICESVTEQMEAVFLRLVSFDLIVSLRTVGESCDVGTSINDC